MYGDLIREIQGWGGWPGTNIFDEFDQMMPNFGFSFGRGPLELMQFPAQMQSQMQSQMGPPSSLFPRNMMNFDFSSGSNCHSFMRQSVVSMSSGPDGRPQIYEETYSSTMAPGGIKETQQTVSDSRTGTKKMAIGHQIGERAHILERERNVRSGEEEERQEFINLDEDEVDNFNQEWMSRARGSGVAAINGSSVAHGSTSASRHAPKPRQLALPSTSVDQQPSTSRHNNSGWKRALRLGKKSVAGKTSSSPRTLEAKGSSKEEEEEKRSQSPSAPNPRKRKGIKEDDASVRKHNMMKKTK